MSDNFTPLPTSMSTHQSSGMGKKQMIGGILTFVLLLAVGTGFFLVNRVQNTSTKAFSTDMCVSSGGFEWASSCPPNTREIGKIETGTGTGDSGDGQGKGTTDPGTGTGGLRVCCVPKDLPPTIPLPDLKATEIPPTIPLPDLRTTDPVKSPPPVPNMSCKLPQPAISINCPNGCVQQ